MGTSNIRFGAQAIAALLWAVPVIAADKIDNGSFVIAPGDNVIVPPPSEEALIFTGQDEKPLTPSANGFRQGVDSVVAGARAFSSWLGPETWLILIAGFGVVGLVVRRTEGVLRFEPRRDDPIDRTDHPEVAQVASAPDASIPPHSNSDRAPSARQGQAE